MGAALVVGVGAGTGAIAVLFRRLSPAALEGPAQAAALTALALLLVPVVLLAFDEVVSGLRRFLDGRPMTTLMVAGGLILPYLLYWKVAADSAPAALARILIYAGGATLLACVRPPGRIPGVSELLVAGAVWLPLEFRWLNPAFPWPAGGSGRILAGVLGLDLLLFLFLVVRRYDGMGYSLLVRRGDLAAGTAACLAFLAVGVPLARLTGFVGAAHRPASLLEIPVAATAIFLFTGLPEETLFRGVIQGLLGRVAGRPWPALLLASVIFGAAHLDNGPAPDWRYFALATLAGVGYGWAYLRTGRIAAAALAHALVDATWVLVFKPPG